MFKKRARPSQHAREAMSSPTEELQQVEEDEQSLEDLLELRRMRKAREGIDVRILTKGGSKRRKRLLPEEEETISYGLQKASEKTPEHESGDEGHGETKAKKVIRANNFTQQTNALDVDKHMMAYIEENLKARQGSAQPADIAAPRVLDPQEELFRIDDRFKVQQKADEGSVTNSIGMLTAIPEVDLGMDTRLKNIEETEKAKRQLADDRNERRGSKRTEEDVNPRFYRPNRRQKTDAEIMRGAKLEALGLPHEESVLRPSHHDRPRLATDEQVMERFKKRLRK